MWTSRVALAGGDLEELLATRIGSLSSEDESRSSLRRFLRAWVGALLVIRDFLRFGRVCADVSGAVGAKLVEADVETRAGTESLSSEDKCLS